MPIRLHITCDLCGHAEEPYNQPQAGLFGQGGGANTPPGWFEITFQGAEKVLPPSADKISDATPRAGPAAGYMNAYLELLASPVQVHIVVCPECWAGGLLLGAAQETVNGMLSAAKGEELEARGMGQVLELLRGGGGEHVDDDLQPETAAEYAAREAEHDARMKALDPELRDLQAPAEFKPPGYPEE